MSEPIVIEFAAENRNPLFPPLPERPMRGRFDPVLAIQRDKDAGDTLIEYPDGIPGQQLAIDPDTGEAAIVEPLHNPRHGALVEKLKKRGLTLPPAREKLDLDKPTALFWAKQAVADKQAVLISGKLPEKIDGKPRLNFIISEPPPSPMDRLTEVLAAQAAAFNRVADALEKSALRK